MPGWLMFGTSLLGEKCDWNKDQKLAFSRRTFHLALRTLFSPKIFMLILIGVPIQSRKLLEIDLRYLEMIFFLELEKFSKLSNSIKLELNPAP